MIPMTGRTLHDALLRVLCEAELRKALHGRPAAAAAALGEEEASALAAADRTRLTRLARFMARHFYRERLVRLFRHTRAVLQREGRDVIDLLDAPAFREILDGATLGSLETAERAAAAIEDRCRREAEAVVAMRGSIPSFFEDLIRYEGVLFRVEAGPRRWRETVAAGGAGGEGLPRLSPWARVLDLDHDLPPILDVIEDLSRPLPVVEPRPTRLLASLDPKGVVNVVRCPDGVARLLAQLDGGRSLGSAAEKAGLTLDQAESVMKQLRAVSAVVP